MGHVTWLKSFLLTFFNLFVRPEDQIEGNVTDIPGYWECGLNKACGRYEEYCDTYTTTSSTTSASTTTARVSTFSKITTALFPDLLSTIVSESSTSSPTAGSLLSSTVPFTTSFVLSSSLHPILATDHQTASTSPFTLFSDTTASPFSTYPDDETTEAATKSYFWESTMSGVEIPSTFSLSTAGPTADYSASTAETSTTATGRTTTGLLETGKHPLKQNIPMNT